MIFLFNAGSWYHWQGKGCTLSRLGCGWPGEAAAALAKLYSVSTVSILTALQIGKLFFMSCFSCTDGILFVVDSVDTERMEEAKMELMRTAKCPDNQVL